MLRIDPRAVSFTKWSPEYREKITVRPHIAVNSLFLIPGEVGGTETYLCKILEAACRRFPEIKITVFSNVENHSLMQTITSIHSHSTVSRLNFRAGNRYMRIFREQTELPARVRACGADVLWNPGYTAPLVSACPQVVTIHDMQYKRHPEDLTWIARMTTDLLIKIASKRVHRYIAISEFSKSEIIRFTSIPAEKIHVTLLAAEEETAPISSLPVALKSRVSPDAPYILTVANSYPHKNLHTLVDAFEIIKDQIPHCLVIVGKPRFGEDALQKSLAKVSSLNRVVRILELSRDELFSLYRNADVFVFPSLYEGFGLPVLEAMMCGAPVVTTRMASIPEVGGDCVIYVDSPTPQNFARKVIEVIGWDQKRRFRFTQAAKTRAKTFSWEKTAEQTIHVLVDAANT
ncbi:MAG: glycosyltransferase family 4 protein [Deltaproteobacteria bacterium]|nr:glycosyltransferase family 4 protein [Deltaproteobacteria bacterium]